MSNLLATSNADYHADATHQSSSGLKLLLKDPGQYYQEYVLGKRSNSEAKHFVEGSLLHSMVLEPHKIEHEYAVFPGVRKAGKLYEEFKRQHAGKRVISAVDLMRVQSWAEVCHKAGIVKRMLAGGVPEHTMVGSILDVPCKSRADYINVDAGYIIDLKSTSAPTEPEIFAQSVGEFGYDLSAAFYCEIARQTYGRLFEFYWIVVSKQDLGVQVYRASSNTLSRGTGLYTQALVLLKRCQATNIWRHDQPQPDFSDRIMEVIDI